MTDTEPVRLVRGRYGDMIPPPPALSGFGEADLADATTFALRRRLRRLNRPAYLVRSPCAAERVAIRAELTRRGTPPDPVDLRKTSGTGPTEAAAAARLPARDQFRRAELRALTRFLMEAVGTELCSDAMIAVRDVWRKPAERAHQALFDLHQSLGIDELIDGDETEEAVDEELGAKALGEGIRVWIGRRRAVTLDEAAAAFRVTPDAAMAAMEVTDAEVVVTVRTVSRGMDDPHKEVVLVADDPGPDDSAVLRAALQVWAARRTVYPNVSDAAEAFQLEPRRVEQLVMASGGLLHRQLIDDGADPVIYFRKSAT